LEIQLETTYGLGGILCQKMEKAKTEEVDTLSEWVKAVRSLVQIRINIFKMSMSTKATSVLKDSDLTETMSTIHEKYVVFPADKTRNNIVL
jgi:hypothetical protein